MIDDISSQVEPKWQGYRLPVDVLMVVNVLMHPYRSD